MANNLAQQVFHMQTNQSKPYTNHHFLSRPSHSGPLVSFLNLPMAKHHKLEIASLSHSPLKLLKLANPKPLFSILSLGNHNKDACPHFPLSLL
jgi:hypothetical protein